MNLQIKKNPKQKKNYWHHSIDNSIKKYGISPQKNTIYNSIDD